MPTTVSILLIVLVVSLTATANSDDVKPVLYDLTRLGKRCPTPALPTNEVFLTRLSQLIPDAILHHSLLLSHNSSIVDYYCSSLRLKTAANEARQNLNDSAYTNPIMLAELTQTEHILSEMEDGARIWQLFNHISYLVDEASLLLGGSNEFTSDFINITTPDLKASIEAARAMTDAIKEPWLKRIAEERIARAEDCFRQMDDLSKKWNVFVAARDAAELQFAHLQQPLDQLRVRKMLESPEFISSFQFFLKLAGMKEAFPFSTPAAPRKYSRRFMESVTQALQNLMPMRETIAELERLNDQIYNLGYYSGLRSIKERVERAIKQGEDLVEELKTQNE